MRDDDRRSDTARPRLLAAALPGREKHRIPRLYGLAASAAALEDGFTPDEIGQVLAGRRIVDAFPVLGNESVATYAHRAVCEMMTAYVAQDIPAQDIPARNIPAQGIAA